MYWWTLGVALSPFMALLLFFIARVIIKRIEKYIPNWLKPILFFRW
jgi:hypothetical protein